MKEFSKEILFLLWLLTWGLGMEGKVFGGIWAWWSFVSKKKLYSLHTALKLETVSVGMTKDNIGYFSSIHFPASWYVTHRAAKHSSIQDTIFSQNIKTFAALWHLLRCNQNRPCKCDHVLCDKKTLCIFITQMLTPWKDHSCYRPPLVSFHSLFSKQVLYPLHTMVKSVPILLHTRTDHAR